MKTSLFVLLCLLPTYVECANGTQAKALRTRIFDTNDYDKKIRPADDQSDATGTLIVMIIYSHPIRFKIRN